MMNEDTAHDIGVNIDMAKNIMADKIYESDASALREQYTNALSHGCVAYHEKYGYIDDVYVDITFDHGERTVTIRDNGMGMSKDTFKNVFMYFGNSSVSKTENNKRSGMFGLGAISFFRIASSCIVESYHRETGQHYSFMTRGKNVTEILDGNKIMMGGEHNPDKGIIGDYGTSTKIYLKENVKIKELVEMVKVVGANYPARTLLHVLNSEGEQSIQTYQQEDQDEELELPAVHTFEDFVKLQCGEHSYRKALDNDFVEVYITDLPNVRYGESPCDAYLCRVPIKLALHSFNEYTFRTFVNIKQEKYMGIDDEGDETLLAIPMMNRDRAEQRADQWLDKQLVDEIIPVLAKENHFTTVDEFRNIPDNWMSKRYNMNNILDDETKEFIRELSRITVRTRTIEKGLSKAGKGDTSLWQVVQDYTHVFYHQTCHDDSFRSVVSYLESNGIPKHKICVIGETVFQRKKDDSGHQVLTDVTSLANTGKMLKNMMVHDFTGYDVQDLKDFKKRNALKAVRSSYSTTYDSGAKVWSPRRFSFSIPFTEDELQRVDMDASNVYWAGDYIKYADVRNTHLTDYPHKFSGINSKEIGIIVAKKYPKTVPNINELFEKVEEMIELGEVYLWDIDNSKKKLLEGEWWVNKTEGLDWDEWTADFEIKDTHKLHGNDNPEHDVSYTYSKFTFFDSEKHVALTTCDSKILRTCVHESGYSHHDAENPIIITGKNTWGDVQECRRRAGVVFAPSEWMDAVMIYFKLKHDKVVARMTDDRHKLDDLKNMPTWTTATDADWDHYYEDKQFNALVTSKISERYLKYPTVQTMTQWAREGDIDKFENVAWGFDEIYKTSSPEQVDSDELKGLEDHDRKQAEKEARSLLMELHPHQQVMADIIRCGLKKDDCIMIQDTYNNIRSDAEVLEIEEFRNNTKHTKAAYGGYQMFINIDKFERDVRSPSLEIDHWINFNDERISLRDDNTIVITTNNHVNNIIDNNHFYYKNQLYKKYDEWEWHL